ncbi:MAG: AMP-binding protein, partial [Gammaproteobacteria bacterium]
MTATGAFNAAHALLAPNLEAGRGPRTAYIDDAGSHSYADLDLAVRRAATFYREAGVSPEQRVLLCMADDFMLPVAFLGAIYAGAVPVPVNTLLTDGDYAYLLDDSRARLAITAPAHVERLRGLAAAAPASPRVIDAGD